MPFKPLSLAVAVVAAHAVGVAGASLASPANPLDLDFADGSQGGLVDFGDQMSDEAIEDGTFAATLKGKDPQLRFFTTDGKAPADDAGNAFAFDPDAFEGLEITMQVDAADSAPAKPQRKFTVVFYNQDPAGDPTATNPKGPSAVVKGLRLRPGGSMATYFVDFGDVNFTRFKGDVEGFRIDPIDGPAAVGATLQIKRIRLVPKGG